MKKSEQITNNIVNIVAMAMAHAPLTDSIPDFFDKKLPEKNKEHVLFWSKRIIWMLFRQADVYDNQFPMWLAESAAQITHHYKMRVSYNKERDDDMPESECDATEMDIY